jgi:hypothetical protein
MREKKKVANFNSVWSPTQAADAGPRGRMTTKTAGQDLTVLNFNFSVELPGIEPVSGCWSRSRTGTGLRNDIQCDASELNSVDSECAQNAPSQSFD